MKESDVQKFWDEKILGWEADKYEHKKLFDVNRSVKFRMQMVERIIQRIGKESVIVELGCGSARLIEAAELAGAKKYIGVDISERAIEYARQRESVKTRSMKVELYHGDLRAFHFEDADLCLSLGVCDWLKLTELHELVKNMRSKYFLHSYSEKRNSIEQAIHSFYVFLMYGHKMKHYVPKYYTEAQIRSVFANSMYEQKLKIYRQTQMRFGTWAYHLPGEIIGEMF